VAHHAVARGLADDDVALVVHAHHRGREVFAQRIGKQHGTLVAKGADERMRSTEIDADDHP
jgi:hypothetical protein